MEVEVAKIVGAINDRSWSQVHSFKPEGERLRSHGQLVAAMAFKAKRELEVASFGTEIITRLQETYYSNESKSLLKKLTQTMESLAAEFLEAVELEIVMAVVWQIKGRQVMYVGKSGGGQAWLVRKGKLVRLLSEEKEGLVAGSGELEAGDRLLLGTDQFFEVIPEGTLGPALSQVKASQVVESLAPVVHGHEKNSQAAAAMIGIKGETQETEEKREEIEEEKKEEVEEVEEKEERYVGREQKGEKQRLGKWLGKWWRKGKELMGVGVREVRRRLGRRGGVYVKPAGSKKQRSAATVVIVLTLVLGVSLVLAGRKRQMSRREAALQQLIEEVEYRYKEGESLLELNPLRAKSLLSEAKGAIEEYRVENEAEEVEELDEWQRRIEELLSQVQREYEVETASEWFNFSLVKEGFKGIDWDGEEEEMVVWGEGGGGVVKVNLRTKAAEMVKAGEELEGGEWVGLTGKRVFVVGKEVIKIVDVENGEIMGEVADEWSEVKDAAGFSSNLYVLDGVSQGQIWKYMGVESGLSSAKPYLKGEEFDLSEAVDMAIDGSVWLLFSDGTVVKYTRGVKDAFVIAGLDQEFEEPVKLFTSPEVERLYVLDKQRTRVAVMAKSGE